MSAGYLNTATGAVARRQHIRIGALLKSRVWRLLALITFAVALSVPAGSSRAQDANAKQQADQTAGKSSSKPNTANESATLKAVLGKVQSSTTKARAQLKQREAKFRQQRDTAQQKLAQAKSKLNALENQGTALEHSFDAKKVELDEKAQLLKDKIGALKELFGVFQQNASDLIGAFHGSPTSIQYPNREQWLESFANRMKNASEVSSVDDIKGLWFEMQREITASSDSVRLSAPVQGAGGELQPRKLVRVGTFNLVTDEPTPAYLVWQANNQQVAELGRQPASAYLSEVGNYVESKKGVHPLGIDPTGGALLSLLVEKPTLGERIDQGGLVGYMILALGVVALLLAAYKLFDILIIGSRVQAQRRNLDRPDSNNALGRVLQVYQDHRQADTETVEMRLHERVAKERIRVKRFIVFLGIIAAVAPLMGLLGTVVGMINTFQAITLYGTGDPQTMAGGISQALITTVLGLCVAVPTVMLHAILSGRARGVVNVLQQQSAALTGDRMAARDEAERKQPGYGSGQQPQPA